MSKQAHQPETASRWAATLAVATILAIVYIPAAIIFVLVLKHFGSESISVENFATFYVAWMITDGAINRWKAWNASQALRQ